MLYYRAIKPDKLYRFNGYCQTVNRELFTPAELKKYSVPDKHGCRLRREWLQPVNIPKNRTYFFFGARFEMES